MPSLTRELFDQAINTVMDQKVTPSVFISQTMLRDLRNWELNSLGEPYSQQRVYPEGVNPILVYAFDKALVRTGLEDILMNGPLPTVFGCRIMVTDEPETT